jgi:hypothetical protein
MAKIAALVLPGHWLHVTLLVLPPAGSLAASTSWLSSSGAKICIGSSSSSRWISSTPSAAAHRPTPAAATAAAVVQTSVTITTPDDWHLHVRDGDNMRSVVPHTAAHFARAIIMPNLVPPVTNVKLVSIQNPGAAWVVESSAGTLTLQMSWLTRKVNICDKATAAAN